MKTNSIGTINNQEIQVILNEDKEFVSLKQICNVLGISYDDEVSEVKEHYLVKDRCKSLEFFENEEKVESVFIPLKYMIGYIGVVSNKTTLSKKKYIETKIKIMDSMWAYLRPL